MERIVIQSSHPRALKTCYLNAYYILWNSEHKVFNFSLEGHRDSFLHSFQLTYNFCRNFNIKKRKTIFENAKVLKSMVLSSSVRQCIHQTFKTFWTWTTYSGNFFSFHFSLLYEELIPVTIMVSLNKSIHFMPQTVTFTLFNTPVLAILNFLWFGFKPKYFENVHINKHKHFNKFYIRLLSLKKKNSVCIS